MSKQLILIRHSYAENGSFNTNDIQRSLTPQGVIYAQEQGEKLNQHITDSSLIISSDAKRAQQTTDIISAAVNYKGKIIYEHFLYQDYSTQDFIDFISQQKNIFEKLVIIGHNPTLANIAYRLYPGFMHSVTPGTIIILDFKISNWTEIEVGKGNCTDIIN